ncbi:MAG: Basal-body rod modification protein FlgD [Lachnoclostridium sp.]|jgi:flagellar basal-body rod modification protein FlgD
MSSISSLIESLNNSQSSIGSTSTTTTSSSSSSSSLDKNAFLQLLVTQMKYQDPLNPNTDTEYVAQLATFSQLEQLQNLNQTYSNSQAFGLVGMNVVVKTTDSSGKETKKSGTVDYVVISNGTAKLSVGGSLYTLDQLDQVIDSTYLLKQGLPYITKEVKETFDKSDPKDITFEVNMGSGDTVANNIAVILNGEVVNSKYVTVTDNKVTISKEAFMNLENGVYKPTIVFDDSLYTTVSGKITITVTGTASENDDTTTGDDSASDDETDTGENGNTV